MPHSALKLMPGVDVNKTPALNEAAISESQLIRFIPDRTLGGLVQKLGGWTKFYAGQIGSTVRCLWAWEDTNANSYLAVGADGIAPIVVTGASGNGTTATLTFTGPFVFTVNSAILVGGINPNGYNGTYVVTAATSTSVSYANATTTAYVSGGTITGIARYLKSVGSDAKIILADPVGSTLAGVVNDGVPGPEGSYTVEGIGQNFVPDTADMSLIDKAYSIPDAEAIATVRELLLKEGVLAGSSSGTLIASALRWCREQTEPKRVVTFVCDTGAKYLSKVYNDAWLADQGLSGQPMHGDLSDLISRKYENGDVVVAGPDDTLDTAFKRMRGADVSQLPIIQDGRLVGILDESDLVHVMNTDEITRKERFARPVASAMTRDLDTVQVGETLDALIPLFDRDRVAIILDGEQFVGLITRTDLINHLSLNR